MTEPHQNAPITVWQERHLVDNRGRRVIEKVLQVENGVPLLMGGSQFHGIAQMILPGPGGQPVPHQFTFEIRGVLDAVEAFEQIDLQVRRGQQEELARLKAEAMRQTPLALPKGAMPPFEKT